MGETLYNGIELPDVWPPRIDQFTDEPMTVPYLADPPAVISIDVGRQLFIDDFLVEKTSLRRVFHTAQYHPENPILEPDRPWEKQLTPRFGNATAAMPFSGGVWFDPSDNLFKMFYMGGFMLTMCLATSTDGVSWDKPELDVDPGTNVVLREGPERNVTAASGSTNVWLDYEDPNPQRRWKMFSVIDPDPGVSFTALRTSPDGIHWSEQISQSPPHGDRSTVFRNPFRKLWVHNVRDYCQEWGRYRTYVEDSDSVKLLQWQPGDPVLWIRSDSFDPPRPELGIRPQLYTLDCVAYESLLLGSFSIWRGECEDGTKKQDICLGFSRDGFHWDRPDRHAFMSNSQTPDEWNWGYMHSAGGVCLVVGDELYFYACGRSPVPGGEKGTGGARVYKTGLATLRRDGFASMEADSSIGWLTTRLVRFTGRHLFVNAAAKGGELRVEVLDEADTVIEPFTVSACVPLSVDKTLIPVEWNGKDDLSELVGKPVKFRFRLRNASLYSFWISPDKSGGSRGFLAAGGPGIPGPADIARDLR